MAPTAKPRNIMKAPVFGSLASKRKAASPIVEVNTATTEPKLIPPVVN